MLSFHSIAGHYAQYLINIYHHSANFMHNKFEIYSFLVEELLLVFQDVAFLLSRASIPPHFLIIVVEVKASGLPYIIKLFLG